MVYQMYREHNTSMRAGFFRGPYFVSKLTELTKLGRSSKPCLFAFLRQRKHFRWEPISHLTASRKEQICWPHCFKMPSAKDLGIGSTYLTYLRWEVGRWKYDGDTFQIVPVSYREFFCVCELCSFSTCHKNFKSITFRSESLLMINFSIFQR